MITKAALLTKYNLTEGDFRAAEISWEDLVEIYEDYEQKMPYYEETMKEFVEHYIADIEKSQIHSYRYRVKSPEHLLAKIIKKRRSNYDKYKNLTKDNYKMFLTDLIGIRVFVLFKAEWYIFHKFIISCFENDKEHYVLDSIRDYDEDQEHNYFAEAPRVYVRQGDDLSIYGGLIKDAHIKPTKTYRSIHYIIKYKGVYLEIQLRTLFEEGWGEIDHAIVYPYNEDNTVFKKFSELINRCAGMADEMGTFFYMMHHHMTPEALEEMQAAYKEPFRRTASSVEKLLAKPALLEEEKKPCIEVNETPQDMIDSIIQE